MKNDHFSSQCMGVGLVVLKLGFVGRYYGSRTPILRGHNLSRLGFDSLRGDEYYYLCGHFNLKNSLCHQKIYLLFMFIAELQLSFIIE
jgi:hypothetical protein